MGPASGMCMQTYVMTPAVNVMIGTRIVNELQFPELWRYIDRLHCTGPS